MLEDPALAVSEFNALIYNVPGFTSGMWDYQKVVAKELLRRMKNSRFIVVMMPTGSGKTLLEVFTAWALIKLGFNVLVLEPTRFLVDQATKKTWIPVLHGGQGGISIGSDYEGRCDVYDVNYKIIISTPQTALKCVERLPSINIALVVDEVHHTYSSKYYSELIEKLRPKYAVGFTALVPTSKKLKLPEKIYSIMGEPYYLAYDFTALEKMGSYIAPKVILDIYDAELGDHLQNLYMKLYLNSFEGIDRRLQSFLARTLMMYGLDAYCESLYNAIEKGRAEKPREEELLAPCMNSFLENQNHKVRVLLEALSDYWDDSIKPVIIFTSRVATAQKAIELIQDNALLSTQLNVSLLTGQTSKEERGSGLI